MVETIFDIVVGHYIPIMRWVAIVVFFFGMGYRLWGWVRRKPTSLMLKRVVKTGGLGLRLVTTVVDTIVTNIGFQTFIIRRSIVRWIMHFLIFLGGGGFVIFHALPLAFNFKDWPWFLGMLDPETSVFHYVFLGLLSIGVLIAITRRISRSEVPVELSSYNVIPIVLVGVIVTSGFITGFLIPVLDTIPGWQRSELECFNIVHIVFVYITLASFPFVKFFHFFIRWLALPVNLYISYAEREEQRSCANCGEKFASEMRMRDLVSIVGELTEGWLLNYCPKCRRAVNAQLDRAAPSITRPEPGL